MQETLHRIESTKPRLSHVYDESDEVVYAPLVGAPSLSIEPQVIPARMEFGRVTTWTIEGGKVRVVIENTHAKMDAN